MATQIDLAPPPGAFLRHRLFSLAPLLAVAVVWLTTAGHTLNFREMNAARGWVAAEAYSLHSSYLIAVGLTLLGCPRLAVFLGPRSIVLAGLALFSAGSFVNGVFRYWPLEPLLAARVAAGIGGGMILFGAPQLLNPRWDTVFAWAGIILPPLGPPVISGASFAYGWSAWEGGFLFEGLLGVIALAAVATMPGRRRSRRDGGAKEWPLFYLPWLFLAAGCFWYCLHWGQLEGWYESPQVLTAMTVGAGSLIWTCWLLWPVLATRAFRENLLRFILMAFGGAVQFYHGTTMTIYSGLFVNFNVWQRFWLVWSMPLGAAAALGFATLWLRRRPLGLLGALAGLLSLAVGMYLLNRVTMGWQYWLVQNTLDLNWFQAPLHWQQAPGRLIVGFGWGLLLAAVTSLASRRADVELHVRQLLPVLQTVAGGFSIAVLVTWLLVGHQTHYSYTAEASSIQTQEMNTRLSQLRDSLIQSGVAPGTADRQALVLYYRAVNYQADNLTYAEMYAVFGVASLVLASVVFLVIGWERLCRACPSRTIMDAGAA